MNKSDQKNIGYQLGMLVLIIFGLFFMGQLLMGFAIGAAGIDLSSGSIGTLENAYQRQIMRFGALISHIIPYTIGSLIWLNMFYKEHILSFLKWKKWPKIGFVGLSIILLITVYPLVAKVTQWSMELPLPQWARDMSDSSADMIKQILVMDSPMEFALSFLLIGIAPAIGEELLYRGILQNKLKQVLPNPHIAIFIASALFSLNHFALDRFLGLMILGLVMGYAYHYSRNFWVPVILHFINNSFQVLGVYLNQDTIAEMDMDAMPDVPIIGVLISVAVAGWILYTLMNLSRQIIEDPYEQELTA